MTCKVFVGNLAFQTTDQALAEAFQDCGKVKSGVVITRGRRSLGYGFVEFEAPDSAEEAVKSKNNTLFKERTLKVELASDNPVRSSERSFNNPNPAATGPSSSNTSTGGDNNVGGPSGGAGAAPRRRKRPPLGGPPRGGRQGGPRPNLNSPNPGDPGASKSDNTNKPLRGGSPFNPPGTGGNPSKQQQGYEGGGGGRDNNNPRPPPRRRRPPLNNNNQKNQNVTDRVLSKTAVFVANLPFGVKDDELSQFFKDNNPKAAHVVVTRNGRSRGYGFVDFTTEADQTNAIYSKNNLIFPPSERKITVTPSYKTQELAN